MTQEEMEQIQGRVRDALVREGFLDVEAQEFTPPESPEVLFGDENGNDFAVVIEVI